MKRYYLLTGANGHLGHTIAAKLREAGEEVRGLVLPNDPHPAPVLSGVELMEGDVCKPETLEPFFHVEPDEEGPREVVVIHTAGLISISSRRSDQVRAVNVEGTRNVVDMCRRHHVSRLVHVSSVHAIPEGKAGEPIVEAARFDPGEVEGLYAKTKAEASQLVLDAAAQGLDAVIVHPSGILGPGDFGQGHLTQMIADYLNGRLVACVKGGYDFVDVRDVADGVIAAAEKGRAGECYILSNRHYEVRELLDMASAQTGKKRIRVVLPMWLAKATAPLSELYYRMVRRPPLYTRYSLYTLTSNSCFCHRKADEELGYRTRSMEATLRDTADFLIRHGRVRHPGRLCLQR